MRYENFISRRYLTVRKSGFLGFLHTVSVAGVAVGVMALIVVTGIMTGFGNNLRDKIIGTTPHIVVEKETGVTDYAAVQERLAGLEGVVGAAPFVQGNVFLQSEGQAIGLILRGIDPATEGRVTRIKEYLKEGDINALGPDGIIIGQELARYGGYEIGDDLTLIAPGAGIAGRGWNFNLKVVGIFNTGMVDYDTGLVVVNLATAQSIFDMPPEKVSGIGLKLDDPYQVNDVKPAVYRMLGYSFLVKTWIDVNRNLFDALFLEKWGLFLILTLMVLVAAFNIVSTLIVTVMSKVHDIGVMQSFGVTRASIRRIFTKHGMFIGIAGTLWGLVLGLGVSFILSQYVKVPEQIYSIDRVPVDLQLDDLLIIVTASLAISYLATIYPAVRASRLQPVEALRYE